MTTQLEQEILDDIELSNYNEFIEYLGIDAEDFEDIKSNLEFDDYS